MDAAADRNCPFPVTERQTIGRSPTTPGRVDSEEEAEAVIAMKH